MQYTKTPRLIRLPKVSQIACQSKSSIYKGMNEGTFPKSISLGARSVAWLEDEILEWVNDRIENRNQMVA